MYLYIVKWKTRKSCTILKSFLESKNYTFLESKTLQIRWTLNFQGFEERALFPVDIAYIYIERIGQLNNVCLLEVFITKSIQYAS